MVLGLTLSSSASPGCGSSPTVGMFHLHRRRLRKTTEPLPQIPVGPHKTCIRVGPGLSELRADWSLI